MSAEDDFLNNPARRNKTDPSTWKSKKNLRGPHQKGLKLVQAIARDAMMNPTPLPSREELRIRCIRGLLAIAESEDVDVRARAVSYKAVLDHTDKVADREEDFERMNDPELRARILELARKAIAEDEARTLTVEVLQLPPSTEPEGSS